MFTTYRVYRIAETSLPLMGCHAFSVQWKRSTKEAIWKYYQRGKFLSLDNEPQTIQYARKEAEDFLASLVRGKKAGRDYDIEKDAVE